MASLVAADRLIVAVQPDLDRIPDPGAWSVIPGFDRTVPEMERNIRWRGTESPHGDRVPLRRILERVHRNHAAL
jgi:hypothetical protein